MDNYLEQLKSMTMIVADTGDIKAIQHHQPQDTNTNPRLYSAPNAERASTIRCTMR